MSTSNGSRVLAIGIDAAEPTLIREMIERNELPTFKALLARGKWFRVESTAHIGSGSVWPTFITGEEPGTHGVYSEWLWRPATMDLQRYHGRGLTSFWESLAQQGTTVGVFDVPFALYTGLSHGFEVSEWGAHDITEGRTRVGPPQIVPLVQQAPAYPLAWKNFSGATPDKHDELGRFSSACLESVRRRGMLTQRLIRETEPGLSLIVFTEVHQAGHQLWHTLAREHEIYRAQLSGVPSASQSPLKDIYREVDQQIARLVDVAGSQATVMLFSLHGMRPGLGSPGFLGGLLNEWGFAQLSHWSKQSWTERALTLVAAAKRNTPEGLRNLYYRSVPLMVSSRVAQPTMLPRYDWTKTRAFSLPTDQFGWIRINLAGRETEGIVSIKEYDVTCRELEELLQALTTEEGKPLVRRVYRTVERAQDALVQKIPDLIVHWEDAAFASPLKIKGIDLECRRVGGRTGQHSLDGFCIFSGQGSAPAGETLLAKDLHRLISELLKNKALRCSPT